MKLQTLLITTFALTLSFSIAEENGTDPYKDGVGTQPRVRVSPAAEPFMIIEDAPPKASTVAAAQTPTIRAAVRKETEASSHETLSFCYEEFSLPLEIMIDLQQKQLGDAALHEHIRKNLKSDSGKDGMRRETFVILRAKSGFPTSAKNKATVVSPDSKTSSQVGYDLQVYYDEPAGMSLRFDLKNTLVTGYAKEMREGREVDYPLISVQSNESTFPVSINTPRLVSTTNLDASRLQGTGSGPRVILWFITASPVK